MHEQNEIWLLFKQDFFLIRNKASTLNKRSLKTELTAFGLTVLCVSRIYNLLYNNTECDFSR